MTGWVYKAIARLKIGIIEESHTVRTEEDSRQLIMKRCMLRGTNVRYSKSVLGIIAITRRQYSTLFIVVLNTELRPQLVVSEIIAITEPWVSGTVLWKLGSVWAIE